MAAEQLVLSMGDDCNDFGPERFVRAKGDKSLDAGPPAPCRCARPMTVVDDEKCRCVRCGREMR